MLVVKLPYVHLIKGGALYDTALDMNLLGFEPVSTNDQGEALLIQKVAFKAVPAKLVTNGNAEALSKYPYPVNNFIYANFLTPTASGSLLQIINALGGETLGIMFYVKAPNTFLTRDIPAAYPDSSVTENNVTTTFTYGNYAFTTGEQSYIEKDGFIYFPCSLRGGAGAATGADALALMNDGCTLLSKNEYITAIENE